eukprot:TRINITY_DN690_c2_g1_i2.p1 TRINITY_DN690_c2_g1~~TRINITY_DN690_c2_g1_i2.p1  ORF type:complete len:362 (+),score=36.86 TRINITY_DN690_c2_g1_i2:88-1086(+)
MLAPSSSSALSGRGPMSLFFFTTFSLIVLMLVQLLCGLLAYAFFHYPCNLVPCQINQLEYVLEQFSVLASRYHVTWELREGVVLGAYRDDAIIPWDNDVDVYVSDGVYGNYTELRSMMKSFDFQRHFLVFSYLANQFIHPNELLSNKIFAGDFLRFYYRPLWQLPSWSSFLLKKIYVEVGMSERQNVHGKTMLSLHGRSYPTVDNITDYLVRSYGADWMVPYDFIDTAELQYYCRRVYPTFSFVLVCLLVWLLRYYYLKSRNSSPSYFYDHSWPKHLFFTHAPATWVNVLLFALHCAVFFVTLICVSILMWLFRSQHWTGPDCVVDYPLGFS